MTILQNIYLSLSRTTSRRPCYLRLRTTSSAYSTTNSIRYNSNSNSTLPFVSCFRRGVSSTSSRLSTKRCCSTGGTPNTTSSINNTNNNIFNNNNIIIRRGFSLFVIGAATVPRFVHCSDEDDDEDNSTIIVDEEINTTTSNNSGLPITKHNNNKTNTNSNSSIFSSILKNHEALIMRMSFSGLMGVSSGYALKKIGQTAALIVGSGFLFLQFLQVYILLYYYIYCYIY